MPWSAYALEFFSGALLLNSVPHIVAGLSGARFQTPFASPPGVGESPPLVNMLWGYANLVLGLVLLWHVWPGADAAGWIAVGLGGLLIGLFLAYHFGRVRKSS